MRLQKTIAKNSFNAVEFCLSLNYIENTLSRLAKIFAKSISILL